MSNICRDIFLTPARMAARYPQGNYERYSFPPHIRDFQRQFFRLLTDPMFNRIVVEVPVRHSKSEHWSRYYPAWILLTRPGKNVMIVAHTQELASEFVDWIRRYIRKFGRYCGRYLDPDQQSKHHLRVMGNGYESECWGFGRGGSLAGRGAHYIVADDLLRSQGDDLKEENLAKVNTWWLEAMARMEPNCKVAIVMSRRAPLDVSGYCLAQNGTLPPHNRWHSIKYPAINDKGEALWPERFPIGWLLDRRKEWADAGEEWMFDCEYLQNARGNPKTSEWPDSYFQDTAEKPLWYTELPPNLSPRVRIVACDPSKGSKSKAGDDCAILYMIYDSAGTIWIDDIFAKPCPIPDVTANLAGMILQHRPNAAICEVHGFQEAVAMEVQRLLDAKDCRIPLHPFDAGSENKTTRIRMALSDWWRRGRLRIRDCPAGRRMVAQAKSFPSGEHDDIIDCAAIGVSLLDELLS